MPDFEFDTTASLETNIESFLVEMDAMDEELATILRDNISTLTDVVRNGERHPRSRGDFNTQVMQALDELLVQNSEEDES